MPEQGARNTGSRTKLVMGGAASNTDPNNPVRALKAKVSEEELVKSGYYPDVVDPTTGVRRWHNALTGDWKTVLPKDQTLVIRAGDGALLRKDGTAVLEPVKQKTPLELEEERLAAFEEKPAATTTESGTAAEAGN